MTAQTAMPGGSAPSPAYDGFHIGPTSALGWWGVCLTVAIFPLAAVLMMHVIPWPILDTAFAPALLLVMMLAAAGTSIAAFVRRDHSLLTVLAMAISAPLAAFGVFMGFVEVLFPH